MVSKGRSKSSDGSLFSLAAMPRGFTRFWGSITVDVLVKVVWMVIVGMCRMGANGRHGEWGREGVVE